MLRKNVASQFLCFAGVNATTGAALSGATFSGRRCIDGTFAAIGATITEDTGLGFYKVALTQADTNGNDISYFFTATNAVPVCLSIVTTAADPTDTVRFGLIALPNAAAEASGGLYTRGSGAGQIAQSANGQIDVDAKKINSIAATSVTTIKAILGYATDGAIPAAVAGAASGLAIVGSNMGTVSSVTGAVGSVTGNVGGNVVGSVASVTAGVTVTTNNDKTGYSLSSTGLNSVLIDGVAMPSAVQYIAASVAGKVSGGGSGTETFKGLDGATTRLTITVDSSGNRTAITYG